MKAKISIIQGAARIFSAPTSASHKPMAVDPVPAPYVVEVSGTWAIGSATSIMDKQTGSFTVEALEDGTLRHFKEIIDERGNVTNVRIIRTVHVLYDPILLKAARDWKYEAPRVSGKPIATVRRAEIVLKP